jgi:hypothetical protein
LKGIGGFSVAALHKIKKCPGHISGRLRLLTQLESMARAMGVANEIECLTKHPIVSIACNRLENANQGFFEQFFLFSAAGNRFEAAAFCNGEAAGA